MLHNLGSFKRTCGKFLKLFRHMRMFYFSFTAPSNSRAFFPAKGVCVLDRDDFRQAERMGKNPEGKKEGNSTKKEVSGSRGAK